MPKIKFVVEYQTLDVQAGRSVREIALEAGIYPNREYFRGFNCGGRGLCGTCKVWLRELTDHAVSPPNMRERFHGMGDGRRLACQARVQGDIEVTTMPGGDDRLATDRNIDSPPEREPDPEPPPKPAAKKPPPKKTPGDDKAKDDKAKDDQAKDDQAKDDKA